ncbi:DUF421 domain-containing protein [Heliobacterium gestii]|uniref:DUF421 domain-containing protein n=1 Tax=Heliomicrobium gestii TaxID=2699 RepID=A0A845LEU2_HELGE|nr:DUF421 domain-containing protein [Heliomicrobium gestii]MBM7866239.1 uncharacterized membrane protein YcaP (DUF421 family) [Heliomicrobium gestii]MZP42965.1 DUF421 domain-containing protein [Heliomicrobium gestii]
MEYLAVTVRIVTILGLLLVLTLLTGRRKIGELPVFDFLVVITIGSIVGADIAEPPVNHLPTVYAVILVILIQTTFSYLSMKYRPFGRLINFEPIVVIENGQFVKANLRKLRYTVDNVLMMLREEGIFDLRDVEFAIIESTGRLSVLKKSQKQPLTPRDLQIHTGYQGLSIPVITEGNVDDIALLRLGLSRDWLASQLNAQGILSEKDVFFATVNSDGSLYASKGREHLNPAHLFHQ